MKRWLKYLLIGCCVVVTSCRSINNLFGKGDSVRVENPDRISFYKEFLKDTVNHAVYLYTITRKDSVFSLRDKFSTYPEAYVFNPKTGAAYKIPANDSVPFYIDKINTGKAGAGMVVRTYQDQYFKKLLLTNTEPVFAHDNLFLRQEKNQFLEVYLLASSGDKKQAIKKFYELNKLNNLSTVHIIDLTLNAE